MSIRDSSGHITMILAIVSSLFLALIGSANADYLALPNGKYLKLPPESNQRRDEPYWLCYAYMRMPEVYLNTFTPSCELFSLELATKFPNVTVAKVPLPDGSWYSSNKKPLAQAYCAAYISSPRAFDGYEKEMQLFNCELPFSQRTRNAVKQLADTVTQTYDSVSGMTTGKECLEKKREQVMLVDAKAVLVQACYWGYEKNSLRGLEEKTELQKTARCIVSSSERFYSFEATLKALNECTKGVKNGARIFNTYKFALYENTRDKQRQRDYELSMQIQQLTLMPRFPITCFHHGDFSICD